MNERGDFARRASLQAYLVAAFSLAYAVTFLGFARPQPDNHAAAALAWALLTGGALSATIAIVGVVSRVSGEDDRRWLLLIGVGYALLSATHGAYAAIAELSRPVTAPAVAVGDLSPIDPRGFATFGLAGLWVLTLGIVIRSNGSSLPRGLGTLAIIDGIDLILLFVATLAGQTALLDVTAALAAVILGPAFWIWTARTLRA